MSDAPERIDDYMEHTEYVLAQINRELEAGREVLRDALHRISLGAQNSGTTKEALAELQEALGKEALAALYEAFGKEALAALYEALGKEARAFLAGEEEA